MTQSAPVDIEEFANEVGPLLQEIAHSCLMSTISPELIARLRACVEQAVASSNTWPDGPYHHAALLGQLSEALKWLQNRLLKEFGYRSEDTSAGGKAFWLAGEHRDNDATIYALLLVMRDYQQLADAVSGIAAGTLRSVPSTLRDLVERVTPFNTRTPIPT